MLWAYLRLFGFGALEQFDGTKLFVGNAHDADIAILGQKTLDSSDVGIGILNTGTMAHIDGELKHSEAIAHKTLAKQRIVLAVFLGFGWQVEENHYPHNAIFAESLHVIGLQDKQCFLLRQQSTWREMTR